MSAQDSPEGRIVVDPAVGTVPDPTDVSGYELWALEGAMPDGSVVRVTVWTPIARPPIFSDAVKAALKAALIALYPSCPRPRT